MKKLTPESRVLSAVKAILNFHGWFVQRNQQGLGNTKGRPDLEALRNGVVIWIECKSPTGKLRKGQPEYHGKLRAHGGRVFIVDDPDKFLNNLESLQEQLWPGQNIKRIF